MDEIERCLYVNSEYEDPALLMVFEHLFYFANQEGLKGRKVSGLKFKDESITMGPQKKLFVWKTNFIDSSDMT